MFRSVLLEDIVRLYRNGLLPGALWRALSRPVLWVGYAVFVAVFYFLSPHTPLAIALLMFLFVFGTGAHVIDCIVRMITPLCFGTFLIGRLRERRTIAMPKSTYFYADFILIPSGAELTLWNLPAGTVGKTYVLVQHPKDPSIALAIIDDDARYMNQLMVFATETRRRLIAEEVQKLRRADNQDGTDALTQ